MEMWIYCGIAAVVMAGLYFLMRKNGLNADIFGAAAGLIAAAEELFADREKSGKEKMTWVVEELYRGIPKLFRVIFTRENLEMAAQWIFDQIERFGKVK